MRIEFKSIHENQGNSVSRLLLNLAQRYTLYWPNMMTVLSNICDWKSFSKLFREDTNKTAITGFFGCLEPSCKFATKIRLEI